MAILGTSMVVIGLISITTIGAYSIGKHVKDIVTEMERLEKIEKEELEIYRRAKDVQ